jgi:hypothetical protein
MSNEQHEQMKELKEHRKEFLEFVEEEQPTEIPMQGRPSKLLKPGHSYKSNDENLENRSDG